MWKKLSIELLVTILIIVGIGFYNSHKTGSYSGAPPYGEPEQNSPSNNILPWLSNWERPEGPAKVALQVGHWKSDEHPEELKNLRGNTGSRGGGKLEWEVNFVIAELVKKYLEEYEINVEILPATVPPSYWADVFISIHADGSTDPTKTGYKIASPWRDYTNNANDLVRILEEEYESATGFEKDLNITRNMRGYYAFSWWRYEHSIHPMTTAAIVETGFLTNPEDRKTIVDSPEISAKGIAKGIIKYLIRNNLLIK